MALGPAERQGELRDDVRQFCNGSLARRIRSTRSPSVATDLIADALGGPDPAGPGDAEVSTDYVAARHASQERPAVYADAAYGTGEFP